MSHNRLSTTESTLAVPLELDPIDLETNALHGRSGGFDYTDPDECDLFRLANDIARYDPALTETLAKIAIRKAQLSEAG
ncbi:MAG: hypothetical protein O3C21_05890 [Verrucomicrobia bacterium]|nr:hypothetical protein [Verrucomicrobiota bacterium]